MSIINKEEILKDIQYIKNKLNKIEEILKIMEENNIIIDKKFD